MIRHGSRRHDATTCYQRFPTIEPHSAGHGHRGVRALPADAHGVCHGVIEATNAVCLQQSLTSAAYEAANVASETGGTATDAQTRAQAVMTALGVKSGTVSISPAVNASTPLGTTIVITCSASLTSNSIVFGYLGAPTLRAVVTTARL